MTRLHHPATRADRLQIKKKLSEKKKKLSDEERIAKLNKKRYREHIKEQEAQDDLAAHIPNY